MAGDWPRVLFFLLEIAEKGTRPIPSYYDQAWS